MLQDYKRQALRCALAARLKADVLAQEAATLVRSSGVWGMLACADLSCVMLRLRLHPWRMGWLLCMLHASVHASSQKLPRNFFERCVDRGFPCMLSNVVDQCLVAACCRRLLNSVLAMLRVRGSDLYLTSL